VSRDRQPGFHFRQGQRYFCSLPRVYRLWGAPSFYPIGAEDNKKELQKGKCGERKLINTEEEEEEEEKNRDRKKETWI
jgi:hypothetical protein